MVKIFEGGSVLKGEILGIVINELGEHTINPEINLDENSIEQSRFEDLLLDSIEMLLFAMNLEDKLNIKIEINEFPRDATISEFVEFLQALKN